MRFILFSICLCLVSCAAIGNNLKGASNLEQRIDAYYRAKTAMDFKEAFKYEHMSLDGKFSVEYYMKNAARSSFVYGEASIVSIDMQENKDIALVKMKVKYQLNQLPGFEKFKSDNELVIEDRWEFAGGNWHHMIIGMSKNW